MLTLLLQAFYKKDGQGISRLYYIHVSDVGAYVCLLWWNLGVFQMLILEPFMDFAYFVGNKVGTLWSGFSWLRFLRCSLVVTCHLMSRPVPYGRLGVIRAWTEYGYFTVPLYDLISDDEEDRDYGVLEYVSNLGDGTCVFVYGIRSTRWGRYVRVETAADCDVCGWVSISDVCSPNDWWQIPLVSRRWWVYFDIVYCYGMVSLQWANRKNIG